MQKRIYIYIKLFLRLITETVERKQLERLFVVEKRTVFFIVHLLEETIANALICMFTAKSKQCK